MLYVLENPLNPFPKDVAPVLSALMDELTQSEWDENMARGHRKISIEQRSLSLNRRALRVANLLCLFVRIRSTKAAPPLTIMQSIERMHFGTNQRDWKTQSVLRHVMSETWTRAAVDACRDYRTPLPFEPSAVYSQGVFDNFEVYRR